MVEEKEKPLTREDVLKLIQENGGTAKDLDLSHKAFEHKAFEHGVDLSGLDLHGIILCYTYLYRAKLDGSNLQGADFRYADLQYATFNPLNSNPASLHYADLRGATLLRSEFRETSLHAAKFGIRGEESHMKARLDETDLRGADLFLARFEGCFLYGTKLQGALIRGADLEEADLKGADWGSYVIGEETKKDFGSAENRYRWLKMWYTDAGMYDKAGEFFFREMTVRRKMLKWWPKPWHRAWSKLLSVICGYGERPFRVVTSAVAVVFGFAFIYFAIGTLTPNTFLNSLYFSAVSFTALGYGQWAPEPTAWGKAIGAFQAFIGVFMMALFLVTFTRKMTR